MGLDWGTKTCGRRTYSACIRHFSVDIRLIRLCNVDGVDTVYAISDIMGIERPMILSLEAVFTMFGHHRHTQ